MLLDAHGRKSGVSVGEELEKVYQVLMEDGGTKIPSQGEFSDDTSVHDASVYSASRSMASTPHPSTPASTPAPAPAPAPVLTRALIEKAMTPPRPSQAHSRSPHKPGFAEGVDDLQDATAMIEQEWNDLNAVYIQMCEDAKSGEQQDIGALLDVISNLKNKGEQLKLMKKTLNNKGLRMPVYSPDAMKRKAAALGILREYRDASLTT
jgi:hypothetical protein